MAGRRSCLRCRPFRGGARGRATGGDDDAVPSEAPLETAYCAEVVAVTYEEMGLLPERRPNWYDPGRFWSGDDLALRSGFRLGGEIGVTLPPGDGVNARSRAG